MRETTPSFKPRYIMVPTDFSPSADRALAASVELAQQCDAQILLFHVLSAFPLTTGVEFPTTFYPQQELLDKSRRLADTMMQKLITHLEEQGLKGRSLVEVGYDVVDVVLSAVKRESVDMVVLSTHGMTGWRPLIFGSNAEKIVKLVQCPLLLLRSAGPSAMPGSVASS